MNAFARRLDTLGIGLLALALLAPARAEGPRTLTTAAGFELARTTVDGGGARSSGGTFALTGTAGQPDAEPLQPSTGGAFALRGGFWPRAASSAPSGEAIFSDGFESR